MSGTPAPAEDPHGSKTSPIMVGGIILSAIAVICLLFFVFSPSSSENDSSSGNKPSNGNVGNEQPVSNIIHVEFSGSFGKVYNIPSGRICNYLNATKPYISFGAPSGLIISREEAMFAEPVKAAVAARIGD